MIFNGGSYHEFCGHSRLRMRHASIGLAWSTHGSGGLESQGGLVAESSLPEFQVHGYQSNGVIGDRGRVMIVVEVNSATSDSWEWADDPNYPEAWAGQGIRIGVNYVIYSMTH